MGQIIMTVEAINWTEGNVGHVHVCLNGGSCRIDWGDGLITNCRTSVHKKQPEWLVPLHTVVFAEFGDRVAYGYIAGHDLWPCSCV